jgi:polar amino acid transport system permease protein
MQSTDPTPTRQAVRPRTLPITHYLAQFPWWITVVILISVLLAWQVTTDSNWQTIFGAVILGLGTTIRVTLIAFGLALLLGLALAIIRLSKPASVVTPRHRTLLSRLSAYVRWVISIIIYQVATLLVEVVRGLPVLVLLLYIAFVISPLLVDGINLVGNALVNSGVGLLAALGQPLADLLPRDVSNEVRAVITLVLAYGVFLSEIFRAGIQSIEPGQAEAARALGMNRFQVMMQIILPQAIRNILPALGNDFIAMLKDSSLVSVLGVLDLTAQTRLYIASTFRIFEGYTIMAYLYLSMTLVLSLLVRGVEIRLTQYRKARGQT